MIGTCHFEKKVGAIIPMSLTRKVQGHEIKRHIVVYKDARFLTFLEIHFSKCLPIIPCGHDV